MEDGATPGSRTTGPAGPVSGAAQRESPPRGQEGDREAEELQKPPGFTLGGFRAAAPLGEQLISPVLHVTQPLGQAAAPQNQHCRQPADVARHHAEPDPRWFGTVLFQAGPKFSLSSHGHLHESLSRLMLLAPRAF